MKVGSKNINIFNNMLKKLISNEEKFLIDLLFKEKEIDLDVLKKINFSNLIFLISEHLLIPTFYQKSLLLNYLEYYPKQFTAYIKKIFYLNRDRNKTLKKEIQVINKLLNNEKIDYVFLKGSAYVINNLYKDFGERMITDIDILVDESQIEFVSKKLHEIGFKNPFKFNFYKDKSRHIPPLVMKNKIFHIEIHRRLVENFNFNFLKEKDVLKKKIKINKIKIPDVKHQLEHNIYNFTINDFGYARLSYDLRNLYDTFLLIRNSKLELKIDNKFLRRYALICSELNIPLFRKNHYQNSLIDRQRFRLRKKNKIYCRLNDKFFAEINKLSYRKMQFKEILYNKNYRGFLLKKLGVLFYNFRNKN
tara:strand:+ start:840 stop:1925 length:1086 start_codon:yes stop_codon:yes gene_type:complete